MGINRIPASVVQYTQYFPSGLPWESNSGDNPDLQHKKYNGKEFIEMNGLNALDYGARLMFPDRGPVFSGVDPLCEKYYSISPYAYCSGNPVNRIDPDGMQETLPYDAYKAYKLYRTYRAAKVTASAGGAFVLGKLGVEYYNDQQMKQRANEVSSSLIQRANLSEENTQKAKAITPEQHSEQKRREERSRQEDAKIAKSHNDIINNNMGTPSPDGSPDPKRPLDEWKPLTIVVTGIAIAKNIYDNLPKPLSVPAKVPDPDPTSKPAPAPPAPTPIQPKQPWVIY